MRKCLRWITLVLAVTVGLSVTALAEGETNRPTITVMDNFTGSTVNYAEGSGDKIDVSVTSSSITPDNQYLIVMVEGWSQNEPVITEDSILYINQMAAGTNDNQGTLTFDVYPSAIKNSTIFIAGTFSDNKTGPVALAVVKSALIFGDVNGDGVVNAGDASLILQHSVKLAGEEKGDFSNDVADVNKSGKVSSADASIILQYVAGYSFPDIGKEVER